MTLMNRKLNNWQGETLERNTGNKAQSDARKKDDIAAQVSFGIGNIDVNVNLERSCDLLKGMPILPYNIKTMRLSSKFLALDEAGDQRMVAQVKINGNWFNDGIAQIIYWH